MRLEFRRRQQRPVAGIAAAAPAAGLDALLHPPWAGEGDGRDELLKAWCLGAGIPADDPRGAETAATELIRAAHEALAPSGVSSGTDVDCRRLTTSLAAVSSDPAGHGRLVRELVDRGLSAAPPPSGQRDLPERRAEHELEFGRVMIGRIASGTSSAIAKKNPAQVQGKGFAVDLDVLRTSLLVVGPPGSGKTTAFARPIIEHLALQSLAQSASVVVLDPKGDDFAIEGWFDYTIDLTSPSTSAGFSLYGGASTAHEAADRLAAALLPSVTADTAYFIDSAKNALYSVLAPFHQAHEGRWPTIRQLLDMLVNPTGSTLQGVRDRLRNQGKLRDLELELKMRDRQTRARDDAASSLAERLGLLNRPHLIAILDERSPKFEMRQINSPTRVRIALPEEQSPDAVKILSRLAISQFVQVVASPDTNRSVFKGLVCDEASRFLDDYVVAAVRKIRSNNAGLVLLTQSLMDIPRELRGSLFASTGCKAVFAGLGPEDAKMLSEYWGTTTVGETTSQIAIRRGTSVPVLDGRLDKEHAPVPTEQRGASYSRSIREVEQPLWSPSEIINDIPRRYYRLEAPISSIR